MALQESHREELETGLAYVRAKIKELKAAERRYAEALGWINLDRQILRLGGGTWSYQATVVGTREVLTGEVIATDQLHAVHRVNQKLPPGQGYGVLVRRTEEEG